MFFLLYISFVLTLTFIQIIDSKHLFEFYFSVYGYRGEMCAVKAAGQKVSDITKMVQYLIG